MLSEQGIIMPVIGSSIQRCDIKANDIRGDGTSWVGEELKVLELTMGFMGNAQTQILEDPRHDDTQEVLTGGSEGKQSLGQKIVQDETEDFCQHYCEEGLQFNKRVQEIRWGGQNGVVSYLLPILGWCNALNDLAKIEYTVLADYPYSIDRVSIDAFRYFRCFFGWEFGTYMSSASCKHPAWRLEHFVKFIHRYSQCTNTYSIVYSGVMWHVSRPQDDLDSYNGSK
jgi:hypothetical protein